MTTERESEGTDEVEERVVSERLTERFFRRAATRRAQPAAVDEPAEVLPPGQMVGREQQYGYLVALMVVAFVGGIGGPKLVHDTTWLLLSLLGLAAAAGIALAARTGKRMLTSIVAVVAGLAVSGFSPLNFVCLIYGGFLMFRHSAAQKKYNQVHPRQPRQARQPGQPRPTRGRRSARDAAIEAGRPSANRRYTPPKAKTTRRGR
jgi:hypothetical protein